MVFALNTIVWLKQPGYPWWPGIVLDPTALEMTLPAECDTCVLCLPSTSSSVAFVNSNHVEEIVRFNPSTDAELLEAGKEDVECAAAIEEALTVYEQQEQMKEESKKKEDEEHRKENREQTHMHMKKKTKKHEKKRRELRERQDSSPERMPHRREKKRSKRHHSIDNEDELDYASSEDDDDDKKKKRKKKHTGAELNRTSPFDDKDQYQNEARFASVSQEDDTAYLEHMLRKNRRVASDSTLNDIRCQLETLMTGCIDRGVFSVSRAVEEQLLDALSLLTVVNVTFDQLRRLKIGVTVGKLLSTDYPVRVVSLALAILRYWFFQLPPEAQEHLKKQSALNETVVGLGRQVGSLGTVDGHFGAANDQSVTLE